MGVSTAIAGPVPAPLLAEYEHEDTRALVQLVKDAAELVRARGEAAFTEFRMPGSRWRAEETYIFVLDTNGSMLVHLDPGMEGKNQLALKDINGRPIIKGLLAAATNLPEKPEGWYHYQWPAPGTLVARWKSSYVRLVTAPSGKKYVVGSGMYNDRMERAFVVDMVKEAVAAIEKEGRSAFARFYDPTGPFLVKDAYIFVYDPQGICLVLPPFTNIEGRNQIDVKDTRGKLLTREMFALLETRESGWVDYMWPKPGESVSTEKSTFVTKARYGNEWFLVGCGVYLADAPTAPQTEPAMTAAELMALVRDAADLVKREGDAAFKELRTDGSRWLHDDTYFFVWTAEGVEIFHATIPSREGVDRHDLIDNIGRRMGEMLLDTAASPPGEGWIHYMFPEPGGLFPVWKSAFVKRVTIPTGEPRIVCSAIYNMQMDKAFIEDVVNRAAALIAARGAKAFDILRDKTGPFVFMDTYVFVMSPEGIEYVNPGQPSLEGKNLIDLRDLDGKAMVQEEIAAAMKEGSAWLDMRWYRPGSNLAARKQTFVRKVQFGDETYIVGSGVYLD